MEVPRWYVGYRHSKCRMPLLTERLALIASDDRCRTPESAFMVNGSLLSPFRNALFSYDTSRLSIPQSLKRVVFLICNGDF